MNIPGILSMTTAASSGRVRVQISPTSAIIGAAVGIVASQYALLATRRQVDARWAVGIVLVAAIEDVFIAASFGFATE